MCDERRRRPAGRRTSCAGSSCCASRAGSPRRWCARPPGARCAGDRDDRVVEVADLDRVGRRRDRPQRRVADVAAGPDRAPRAGSARSPKWRRIAVAPAARPARRRPRSRGTGASARARPPRSRSGTAPPARPSKRPSTRPAIRSGAEGEGAITPARVRWPISARSRSPSPRSSRAERERVERVAAVAVGGRRDPVGEPAGQRRGRSPRA